MRYLDTATKDTNHTLAEWFKAAAKQGVGELRLQTGYFSRNSIDLLIAALSAGTLKSCTTKAIIGSNDPRTQAADMIALVKALGIPRVNAQLGVICFGEGLFHPKTYHIRRIDGSQTAYVGSANLTPSGLHKNVEAGIVLDTRDGDDEQCLNHIACSIDNWFLMSPEHGISLIDGESTIDELTVREILSALPPPPKQGTGASTGAKSHLPKLKGLSSWPKSTVTTEILEPDDLGSDDSGGEGHATLSDDMPTLVAEITKGRMGVHARQIDINEDVADDYFGGTGTQLRCVPVSSTGQLGPLERRIVGTKPSGNWYIELSGLNGSLGNNYRTRPLLLMARTDAAIGEYQFHWLQPSDPAFDLVYDHFIASNEQTRRGNNTIKRIEPYVRLSALWPDNPFNLAFPAKTS